jgi:hypothetical protein
MNISHLSTIQVFLSSHEGLLNTPCYNELTLEASGIALIRAAWACDDEKANLLAQCFRNKAADILLKLELFEDTDEVPTLAVMLVDVLRRSSRFEEARKLIANLTSFVTVTSNPIVLSVLKYQSFLCENGDVSCHTVADANAG